MEDFWILESKDAMIQELYTQNPIDDQWLLYSKRYYRKSIILKEELFDHSGDLKFVNSYIHANNTIEGRFKDSTIKWTFNKDDYLTKEERIYKDDAGSSWIFNMDRNNNLIGINDYEIVKENSQTKQIYDLLNQRFVIKAITIDEKKRAIQTIDFEDLESIIYFDEFDRVVRRINNYKRETVTDYLSKLENKTYLKNEKDNLILIHEFKQKEEMNKIIREWKTHGTNTRDSKEITTLLSQRNDQ